MALSAQKVSAVASPGLAAAATVHSFGGARGVASAQQSPVESSNPASFVGVNDNSIMRYEDEGGLNPDGRGKQSFRQGPQTPYMSRSALVFYAGLLDQTDQGASLASTPVFGDYVSRSIQGYERAQNLVNSPWARQGSSINQYS